MAVAVSSKGSTGDLSHVTLSDLMQQVGVVIRREFEQRYWFTCDIDELKRNYAGHVYMTLSHKNEGGQKSSAKAMIWRNDADLIQRFESQAGISFTKNITVLFLGQITFNSQYGLSIKILDINPTFSIGQHELKLRRIRSELEVRGYSQLNRLLDQPREFTRVAVIAPSNAAGLHDFKTKADLLQKHELCHFDYFAAVFQGERRIDSISAAFAELVSNDVNYDCVCIIRGGGDTAGLSELAEWKIALMVCRCPYPVFTGIGHKNDEILLDEYANIGFATPSMVASHIFNTIVSNAQQARSDFSNIQKLTKSQLEFQRQKCETWKDALFSGMRIATSTWHAEVEKQYEKLVTSSKQSISTSRLSVTKDFNRLISDSKKLINEQRRLSSTSYESMRLGAYKAIQKACNDVGLLKVSIDSQSNSCLGRAKQDIVRNFNNLQVASIQTISVQKNQIHQAWLELRSLAKTEISSARQHLNISLNNIVSKARHDVVTAKLEISMSWSETQTAANIVLERAKDKVITEYKIIDAYDPQKTLERGYSIVYSDENQVLKTVGDTLPGQQIIVRMKDGTFNAKIDEEEKHDSAN